MSGECNDGRRILRAIVDGALHQRTLHASLVRNHRVFLLKFTTAHLFVSLSSM